MRTRESRFSSKLAFTLALLIAARHSAWSADRLAERKKVPVDAGQLLTSVFFSDDGRSCFLLESEGHLRELSVPGFKLLTERNLNLKCSAFVRWEDGFAVYADATQELIILDPGFNETGRLEIPGLVRFTTAPTLDFGYAIGKNQIGTVDLKSAKAQTLNTVALVRAASRVKRPDTRPAPLDFLMATCTHDGKYLVTMADHRINRFAIRRKGALAWEESGWRIGSSGTPHNLNVGGDPLLVAMPYGAGNNRNIPGHPASPGYGTFVYDLEKLSVPKVTITPGACPNALGFDEKLKLIYAQNFELDLIVYNHGGAQLAEYSLDDRNAQTKSFFPHPDGGKLLVLTGNSLFWCELPAPVIDKAG